MHMHPVRTAAHLCKLQVKGEKVDHQNPRYADIFMAAEVVSV